MPSFEIEQQYLHKRIAGVDEAGCGPWAGPVVAAAAVWQNTELTHNVISLIDDSKKLSKTKREKIFDILMELPKSVFDFGVGQASVAEIDSINIGKATGLAMCRAVANLSSMVEVVLVDGIRKPDLQAEIMTVIKGDQISTSIATASIIAKVTRDKIMEKLSDDFPVYGWMQNAGYGTKQHQEALTQYGITEHHRKTYAPIAKLVRT